MLERFKQYTNPDRRKKDISAYINTFKNTMCISLLCLNTVSDMIENTYPTL